MSVVSNDQRIDPKRGHFFLPLGRAKLGRQARLIMEVQFELGRQTQKYVALYESAIAQNRISRAA